MKIRATTQDAYQLIHDGILALARAERQGIRIDTEYCKKKQWQLTKRITRYEKQLRETKLFKRWNHIYGAKTNIYSNHQLSNLLYHSMKITPPKQTESGGGATDEDALKQLGIPELDLVLRARKLAKVRDTYLGSFIRETNADGYMRPNFNLHTVRTYRSSSSDPNFQNIPKRDKEAMTICRRAILPRPGHMLVSLDFSALEVMIGACYHHDPTMLKYLRDKDSDMHGDMAKQIFHLDTLDRSLPAYSLLRSAAKNGFVFPQFYGDYYGNNAKGLCEWVELPQRQWRDTDGIELPDGTTIGTYLRGYGIKSFGQFIEHLKQVEQDFWGNRFRVYDQWRQSQVAKYRRRGYLKMLTGFTCSGIMRKNEIANYPIQGTAFHCLLKTFNQLDGVQQAERWDSRLVGQIHDEAVIDARPDEVDHIEETARRIVSKLSEEWDWIIVPLEIEMTRYEVDGPWVA